MPLQCWEGAALFQDGSGTELEPETGTVRTAFPETESGTGTAGTVFQKPRDRNRPLLLNCPKDPAVLKILRRGKFTMRSKFAIAL